LVLKIECAWCHRQMGAKETYERKADALSVSHSICQACFESIQQEIALGRLKLKSSIDCLQPPLK